MIEYRVTWSKKPTLRLWRVEGNKRKLMANTTERKAELVKEIIFPNLLLKTFMKFRNGLVIYHTDEESAIRLFLALKSISGIRDETRVVKLLESVQKIERGEVYCWYSLFLKLDIKAILALRSAYL